MSSTYKNLRVEVMWRAATLGVTPGVAAMQTMTRRVIAIAKDLPDELLDGVAAAERQWLSNEASVPHVEDLRVAAWRFLEAKNGNSVTIDDNSDIAVRALICVLWDEADEDGAMEEGLEFFARLEEQYRHA